MVAGKKRIEQFHDKVMKRMLAVQEPLDTLNGCIYCYKPRTQGSLYCSQGCKQQYEFHNSKYLERIALIKCAWCGEEQIIRGLEQGKNKLHYCLKCLQPNIILFEKQDKFTVKKMEGFS